MENCSYSVLDVVNEFMYAVIEKLERDYAPEKFKNLAMELMKEIDFEGSKQEAREELGDEEFENYCNFVSMLPGIAENVSADEYKSMTIDIVRLTHGILVKYAKAWNLSDAAKEGGVS